MKKGQNRNFQKDAFQTGLSHKLNYDQLIASVKDKSTESKKAINICKKGSKKK